FLHPAAGAGQIEGAGGVAGLDQRGEQGDRGHLVVDRGAAEDGPAPVERPEHPLSDRRSPSTQRSPICAMRSDRVGGALRLAFRYSIATALLPIRSARIPARWDARAEGSIRAARA